MMENTYVNFKDLKTTRNVKPQVPPEKGPSGIHRSTAPAVSTQRTQVCGTKVFYILIGILVNLMGCVVILGIMIYEQKKEMETVHVILRTMNASQQNYTASLDSLMQENYEQKKEMENVSVILRTMNASQQTYTASLASLKQENNEQKKEMETVHIILRTMNASQQTYIASLDSWMQNSSKRQNCNNGWECFQRCYTFSNDSKNWNDARHACEEDNSHLIVIDSKLEQDVFSQITTSHYWIGLTDQQQEGIWQWVDGTSYDDGVKFWHTGNPDDYHNNEDCTELYHHDGKTLWNDSDCNRRQKWICEKSDC